MRIKCIIYLLILINITSGCKKFVEADAPGNGITALNVYSDAATAAAVLTGIYGSISANTLFISPGLNSLSLFAGMSADEFVLYPSVTFPVQARHYKNDLKSDVAGYEVWNTTYPLIYRANVAIEGISASSNLASATKNQLLGEAKFVRALCYFYLVNLYGNVPLVLSPDAATNATLSNTAKTEVWAQIIKDLKEAQTLLNTDYLTSNNLTKTTVRTRPNKSVATALLARSYLYTKEWANAENEASSILQNTAVYDTVALNKVFLSTSKEAIWQLQPVRLDENTQDARVFSLPATGAFSTSQPVYLSDILLNQFEPNDLRRKMWTDSMKISGVNYNYASKYKIWAYGLPITEFQMVIRLGEVYLIRAEARAQQNKISEAQNDLNVIRKRAGLSNTPASDKDALLSAILKERQVELFSEWGHRWFDLKRTGTIDAAMTAAAAYKKITWQTTDQLYPIPINDINRNVNLEQNTGY